MISLAEIEKKKAHNRSECRIISGTEESRPRAGARSTFWTKRHQWCTLLLIIVTPNSVRGLVVLEANKLGRRRRTCSLPLFMSTAPDAIGVNGSGGGGEQNNNQNSTATGVQLPTTLRRRRSSDFPRSLYDTASSKPGKGRSKDTFNLKVRWISPTKRRERKRPVVYENRKTVSISSSVASLGRPSPPPILESIEQSAQRTRLLEERFYASADAFAPENLLRPPGLRDLSVTNLNDTNWVDRFWITFPARFLTFGAAYAVYPYIMSLLDKFVTMAPDQLDDITGRFGPGIAILYGTFTSLTISILYQRQKSIQEHVATESSLLVLVLRSLLSVMRGDVDRTVEAGQTVADQVRTLVKSSRGVELMQIMYTDPYARLQELLDDFACSLPDKDLGRRNSLISFCRDTLRDLIKVRSNRLAEEARALPPTHFLILNALTSLILLAYCVNTLPTLDRVGEPPSESVLIFGLLTTIYVLFYNFAQDLNNPFDGVYQIRRSTAASHLLEMKWLIVNHPILKDQVDFEEAQEQPDGILVRTPMVGDCLFEKDEFYCIVKDEEECAL